MPSQLYHDEEFGFSFRYPFDWRAQSWAIDGIAVIAMGEIIDDAIPPSAVVRIILFDEEVSGEDVFSASEEEYQLELESMGIRDVNIMSFGIKNIDERKYLFCHFQHTTVRQSTGEDRRVEQINAYFLHKDMFFVVSVSDAPDNFGKNRPVFDSIINSFQFD